MKKTSRPKDKVTRSYDPSRRKFLKGVGIAGAGAAVVDKFWSEAEANHAEAQTKPSGAISGSVPIVLDVNGQKRTVQVEPRTTLLSTSPASLVSDGALARAVLLSDGVSAPCCFQTLLFPDADDI